VSRGGLLGLGAALAALLAAATAAAAAGSVRSASVPGFLGAGGCLNARVCVAGGETPNGVGELFTVIHGRPGKPHLIKKTFGIFSISCPSSRGCVALGMTGGPILSAGEVLAFINSSGRVTRTVRVPGTYNQELSQLACTTLTNCELAGVNLAATPKEQRRLRPTWLVVGHWNGHSIRLHHIVEPNAQTNDEPAVEQVSCARSACYVVGYWRNFMTEAYTGFVWHIQHGTPDGLRQIQGHQLYGIACTTSTICYATDDAPVSGSGSVDTLRDGRISSRKPVGDVAVGIACRSSTCVESGALNVPGGTYGAILTGPNRSYSQDHVVPKASSFAIVTLALGGSFMAVGPANSGRLSPRSEITTGG
jgi:hypothetical protein